eukprot:TRINITY_DN1554_c0_g1_i7.p1 TRINITY_DN1554_c0_g1~~TRINITY_DN1554_c0_g1_i7.p1  ORF type:complete len:538 (+),score=103.12 TRINITY_DN1554_c0_g1_i7:334-1947(+)
MKQHNVSSTSFHPNLQEEILPYANCESQHESDIDMKSDSEIQSDQEIKSDNDAESGDSDIDDNIVQEDEDALSKDKLDKLDNLLKERARRKQERDSQKRHACDFPGCDKKFPRPGRLAIHKRTHTGERPYACQHCDKTYNKKHHLKSHVLRNHQSEPSLTFLCDICDKQFVSKETLRIHKKRTHDASSGCRFKCTECDAAFGKRQDRQKHMASQHPKTDQITFSCDICKEEFATKAILQKHKSSHKTHKCSHCDQVFTRWTEFQQHRKTFSKEKSKCSTCGKMVFSVNMERHKSTHDETRPAIHCPFQDCPRYFFFYRNMKKHFKSSHCDEKFTCTHDGCDKELSSKQKLKEHVKKIHNEEPIKEKKVVKKKAQATRKDKGHFKKPVAAVITRINVENGDALLNQKEKVPLDSLENIRKEGKDYVGSGVESSDGEDSFVGCRRALANMSQIKTESNRIKREKKENEMSRRVANILKGESNILSLFNEQPSDTDTDSELAPIKGHDDRRVEQGQKQDGDAKLTPKSQINFYDFARKKS